jgi:hypothetical protein
MAVRAGRRAAGVNWEGFVKKSAVLELVQAMPDEIDIDELIDVLQLRRQVDESERAIDEGRVLTQDDAERRSREWFR